jgi:site-specific DNA recombinase
MDKRRIVAGYCRVSTLEQKKKGYGIDIQMREIADYAETFGLSVGEDFFIDKARSGVTENRKALMKLLKACKSGRIGGVIVSSLDRLSRDLRLTENLLFEFHRLGVQVHIADMPYYDRANRKDVLLRQIREAIAEENRKEIIERLKKGREERVRKGRMAGGMVPYGYSRAGKDIAKNSHEMEIVNLIFFLRDEEKDGQAIADCLNDQGFTRRNGKPWTQRQVLAILSRDTLYRSGVVRYGEIEGRNDSLIILGK